jgi:uncharacterized protein (TIGR03545 family)
MRWKYIIPRLVVVLCIWAFLHFAMDPLLQSAAVATTQSVIGAKADIGVLQTRMFPPQIDITSVALANANRPGTNLVQFDSLRFSLAGGPLLRRQFVVREGQITGVRFNTLRSDDGLLDVPEEESSEPSWMTEQLQTIGHDWIRNLTDQAQELLDPDSLATYRTGNEIYVKWDDRLEQFAGKTSSFKLRYEALKTRFDKTKHADPIGQIEGYLQIAQEAEQLSQDAFALKTQLNGIVPEARTDFARLDEARRNDLQKLQQTVDLLKPDVRRVSESLIGDAMYRQLQQALTWVAAIRDYQQQLALQTKPERRPGRDFSFPLMNPSPDFHLEKMLLTGELMIRDQSVPFEGMLTDVTEDAPLLNRPCVFRLKTTDSTPLALRVVYDATTSIPKTLIEASYADQDGRRMMIGDAADSGVAVRLAELEWETSLSITQSQIEGQIRLASRVDSVKLDASDRVRPEIIQAANDALLAIETMNAKLLIRGPIRRPNMRLESDFGDQFVTGIQTAMRIQLVQARDRLVAEVNTVADEQRARLSDQFASQYDRLMADNADIIQKVQQVRSVAASLQSGRVDPGTLFRTATESKLIDPKYQKRLDGTIDEFNQKLRKVGLPGGLPKGMSGFPNRRKR